MGASGHNGSKQNGNKNTKAARMAAAKTKAKATKAKSKQEIEANANMTTAQIMRLSFKKSWKVQFPLLWYFVAISLFFSMKGQVGCSSTILGLGSLPVARVVAEHTMDIAAVNISTCSFTLILTLIWMSQCFVKMNISMIFTWHPEIEELPGRALCGTKNRLWLNKAFLPAWMFTAQRLVDDYLWEILFGGSSWLTKRK